MTDEPPNILDRLLNVTLSNRDVKRMITEKAEALFVEALFFQLPVAKARLEVEKQLMEWVQTKSLTGRGTKKMVDKVMASSMPGYGRLLIEQEKRFDSGGSDDTNPTLYGGWAERASRKVFPEWSKRKYAEQGQKAARAFKQKRR